MKILALIDLTDNQGYIQPQQSLALTDASLLTGGKPQFLPDLTHRYIMLPASGILLCNTGKKIAPRFVHRYCEHLAVASLLIDVTALGRCRSLGLPYTEAVSFDFNVARGPLVPFTEGLMETWSMKAVIADREYNWSTREFAPDWRERISRLSRQFTFRTGDLILPAFGPAIPVAKDTHVRLVSTNQDFSNCITSLEYNIK